eukprot:1821026-Rhodomonas_salina.7
MWCPLLWYGEVLGQHMYYCFKPLLLYSHVWYCGRRVVVGWEGVVLSSRRVVPSVEYEKGSMESAVVPGADSVVFCSAKSRLPVVVFCSTGSVVLCRTEDAGCAVFRSTEAG